MTDYWFYQRLIQTDDKGSGKTPYIVKFYDSDKQLVVKADNAKQAEVLAMAYAIHSNESFGVQLITNSITGEYFPSDF